MTIFGAAAAALAVVFVTSIHSAPVPTPVPCSLSQNSIVTNAQGVNSGIFDKCQLPDKDATAQKPYILDFPPSDDEDSN